MKILLGDPRHNTVGAHSYFVPIGIGYIGSHLLKQLHDKNIELKLSTNPKEIFNLLEKWKPDIIAISNYIWNANLSNLICEKAKKNSNTLCILGGPEFPAGTGARTIINNSLDKTYDKCFKYLIDRPSVDYFAFADGEVSMLEIVKKYIENNFSVKSMKEKDEAIMGCASVSKDKSKLHVGDYISRIGMEGSVKAEGRDIIPSPYTTGLLDKFLDGTYVPAFETARGCPFLCTFCDQGLDSTKITTFSVKRLAEEMMYVGKKMSNNKEGTKTTFIFDANWGMFDKDVDLAHEILKIVEKYDWPKYIECLTPKSNWNNLIKINDILKNRVQLSLSMQSLKTETLKEIKRTNWTIDQYLSFINEVKKRGKPTASEMIIPLPNETEESFYQGVKFFMDNHVQTRTWTLMQLVGTELGRDFAIKKYNLKSKYRILPKEFGVYCSKKTFEIEKICVATNTMSFQSYLNCRNYSFILKLLGHTIFRPVYKLTQKLGISWFDFSKKLFNLLQEKNYKSKFKNLFDDFCKESRNECFDTYDEAINFYSKKENYEALLNGEIGENLGAKYQAKSFLILKDIFSTIFFILKKDFNKNKKKELDLVLDSSEKWLRNLYIIDAIIDDNNFIKNNNNYRIEMDFDFPAWLAKSDSPLNEFKKQSAYELNYNIEKIQNIRNEIKTVQGDQERALGRYLDRRQMIGFDLFEKQFTKLM